MNDEPKERTDEPKPVDDPDPRMSRRHEATHLRKNCDERILAQEGGLAAA